MMLSDTEIAQAAQKGDKQAFEALVEKYKNAVYAVILPKVKNYHQAQDLAQENLCAGIQRSFCYEGARKKWGFGCAELPENITNRWLTRKKRDDYSLEELMVETPWLEDKMLRLPHHTWEETPLERLHWTQTHQTAVALPHEPARNFSGSLIPFLYARHATEGDCQILGHFAYSRQKQIVRCS